MSSQDALDIDQTGLLSDTTLSALQISQQPFAAPSGESEAENALFSDEVTAEQLADIKQALINGDDLLLVLGEEGAGKTTLLSQLGTNSGLRIQCFAVKGSPRFSTMNLFAGMLEAFKRTPPETLKQILDELIPCLQTMVSRNTLSAIVLDDAQLVNETELTQLLSGMLYVNSQDETLMRVALAAPSDFENKIPDLLPEGADLPYSSLTIDGLTPNRAAAYMRFRLAQAGYADELPFSEDEMAYLVDQSGGLPAVLHTLSADELNRQHDPSHDRLPAALFKEPSGSQMHSRLGKFALGALASILIVAGLVLFLNPGDEESRDRYAAADQNATDAEESGKKLKLVEVGTVIGSDGDTSNSPGDTAPTDGADGDSNAQPKLVNVPDAPPVVEIREDTPATATEQVEKSEPETAENPAPVIVAAEEVAEKTAESNVAEEVEEQAAAPTQASQDPGTDATSQTSADPQQSSGTASPGGAENAPGYLESPNWILVQNADQYTVQMSASRDRASVENFLARNALIPPNSIYSFERDGDTWFALVHGLFPTFTEAREAVEKMPASAQTNQPWIRSVERVQTILKQQ